MMTKLFTFNRLAIMTMILVAWGGNVSAAATVPDKIAMTAILRDFPYYGLWNPNARVGNPYFQNELDTTGPNSSIYANGYKNGIVVGQRLVNDKPEFAGFMDGTKTWAGGTYKDLEGYFYEMWGKKYKPSEENMYPIDSNYPINAKLTATTARTDEDSKGKLIKGMHYHYEFTKGSSAGDPGYPGFFPIGVNQGWTPNYYINPTTKQLARRVTGYDDIAHNFSFTAEVAGTLMLPKDTEWVSVTSKGDDELWVFINGQMVTGRTIVGGNVVKLGTNTAYDVRPNAQFQMAPPKDIRPGVDPINIKIFFAERKTPGSTFSFMLDVYTNTDLNKVDDTMNISAKAVPLNVPAKVWFDESTKEEKTIPVEGN